MPEKPDVAALSAAILNTKTYKQLTIFAFICSFNLWFIAIYFFGNGIVAKHGYVISGMLAFAFTSVWVIAVDAIALIAIHIHCHYHNNDSVKDLNAEEFKKYAASTSLVLVVLANALFLSLGYFLCWPLARLAIAAFVCSTILLVGLKVWQACLPK